MGNDVRKDVHDTIIPTKTLSNTPESIEINCKKEERLGTTYLIWNNTENITPGCGG
jgi:hypothetical protein